MNHSQMIYSLKAINVEKIGGKIEFPALADRVIEMRGQVVQLTLSGIELTQQKRLKTIKEMEAKRDFEKTKMENIESFHLFIKEMSEKDLHTAWMYFESKTLVKMCGEQAELTRSAFESEKKELEEIKCQIPELSDTILEVDKILNKT